MSETMLALASISVTFHNSRIAVWLWLLVLLMASHKTNCFFSSFRRDASLITTYTQSDSSGKSHFYAPIDLMTMRVSNQEVSFKVTKKSTESSLRNSILSKDWVTANDLLKPIITTKLPSGRDIVYVIVETCRRSNAISNITPLLSSLPLNSFDYTTEDDIMPMIAESSKLQTIAKSYRIMKLLQSKSVRFSAKTYSIFLKGFGKQKNEEMLDNLLIECSTLNIKADVVLLNTAIDAYIRYV